MKGDQRKNVGEAKMTPLRRRLVAAAIIFWGTFTIGVLGYHAVGGEKHSWLDAVYMTANVLTTVGFREAVTVEGNPPAMVFTVVLLFVGAGAVVFATSVVTAFIVEVDLTQGFRSRRMQRAIDQMSEHFIVCGAGATGYAVLRELVNTERPVVVIEVNDERLRRIQSDFPAVPCLKEDFTDDEVLLKAGIARATGIVVCTTIDKDTLVTTITARQLNPQLRIIARGTSDHSIARLQHAGADGVVSPALIGGMRMASELVRPTVVSFLDMMLRDKDRNLRVEEVPIATGSRYVGRTLGELNAHAQTNCLVMATKDPGADRFAYNPPDSAVIRTGTVLIVLGDPPSVRGLQKLCDVPTSQPAAPAPTTV